MCTAGLGHTYAGILDSNKADWNLVEQKLLRPGAHLKGVVDCTECSSMCRRTISHHALVSAVVIIVRAATHSDRRLDGQTPGLCNSHSSSDL